MYIIKQNEYDLMMISLIKQDGTFVHNYHCTFYITVVDGYMYMYVPTQYMYVYMYCVGTYMYIYTCMYLHSTYTVHVYCIHSTCPYIHVCTYAVHIHVYCIHSTCTCTCILGHLYITITVHYTLL